jgi:hypothetical protein
MVNPSERSFEALTEEPAHNPTPLSVIAEATRRIAALRQGTPEDVQTMLQAIPPQVAKLPGSRRTSRPIADRDHGAASQSAHVRGVLT